MSNILVQTKIQSLVFKKYQNVVAVSYYKNDVLIDTFYLNAQLFKNIQLTLMHFRDALTRIKAYHDKQLARLFPELAPVKIKNSPTVNTDNKELVPATGSGVVDSVGDALFSQSELDSLAYILNNINTLDFANDEKEFSELQQLTEKVTELSFSYYHPQTCKHCKKNKITYLQAKSLGVCGVCEFSNTDIYWNSVAHESGIFTGAE